MSAKGRLFGILGFLFGFLVMMTSPVFADGLPLSADLRMNGQTFPIQGLAFSKATVSLRIEKEGTSEQQIIATVSGVFDQTDWILLGPGGKVLLSADASGKGPFQFEVPLASTDTAIRFTAIDPYGKTEEATVDIMYPSYVAASEGSNEVASLGAGFGVALGVTSNSYSQTGLSNLSEIAMTAKISYQRPLSSHWDLGGNVFSTALPVSTNQTGVHAYFVGVNARAGYSLPFIPKPWTVSLAGGVYFATMYTTGITFGYRNMFGPQIFPVVRRSVGKTDMMATYFKYSPVSEGGAFGFSSHELATGLSFTHPLEKRRSVTVSLDYSQITVQVSPTLATNNALTGGVTYGF